jgi:hypothetical protein
VVHQKQYGRLFSKPKKVMAIAAIPEAVARQASPFSIQHIIGLQIYTHLDYRSGNRY